MSMGELAALFTALSALLSAVFLFVQNMAKGQVSAHEGRANDLQEQIDENKEEHKEQLAELKKEMQWQREEHSRQLSELRQAMASQASTISRQETQLGDYARHVAKLERVMSAASLPIPEFETSRLIDGAMS